MAKVRVVVTRGEEVYAPVSYHSFRVGPLSVTFECESDMVGPMAEEWTEALRRLSDTVYADELRLHLERVKTAAAAARASQRA